MKRALILLVLMFSANANAFECTANDNWVFDYDMNQFGGGSYLNCGAYPADDSLRVLTYRTEGRDFGFGVGRSHRLWRVLLAKADKPRVVASATLHLWEDNNIDSTMEVDGDVFYVDKANYPLNATTNAFAIRMDLGRDSYCRDVVRDQFVTLFVREGNKLKPVLKHLPLKQDLVVDGTPCSRYDYSRTARGEGRLTLLESKTNGYRDIKLTTTALYETYDELAQQEVDENDPGQWEESFKPETRQFETTLKFNGHRYPVIWEELPSKEWWQQ